MRKIPGILLMLVILAGTMILTAAAGTLNFVLPEETYGTNAIVTIDLYKGAPTKVNTAYTEDVKNGKMKLLREDLGESCPMPEEPGLYTYFVSGKDCYSVLKCFLLTQEDLDAGEKTLIVEGGKIGGKGFEPGKEPAGTPEGMKKANRDKVIYIPTDEVLKNFEVEPQNYQTPAFTLPHAAHEFTSQEEMVSFVKETAAKSPKLHAFNLCTTERYGYEMPLVVATETEIPENATLEQAGELVRANGKPTVWVEAQIHANETSSGEGALVVLYRFAADAETQKRLEKVNVVIVPRISVESSYVFIRDIYGAGDPNRDHIKLQSQEIRALHYGWRQFMPEATVDMHELLAYAFVQSSQRMYDITDTKVKQTTSLNQDDAVFEIATDVIRELVTQQPKKGIRIGLYSVSACVAPATSFYGMYNGLSFLDEVRGIGGGRAYFERRVYTHEQNVMTIIDYVAGHADEIRTTVAKARAGIVERGKTYDENNLFVLHHKASGRELSKSDYSVTVYDCKADGVPRVKKEERTDFPDQAIRSRPYPTAYVLPADLPEIESILKNAEGNGLEYFRLEDGTAIELQQYYYVGDYSYKDGDDTVKAGVEADLRPAQTVTFANGAYLFPMDQVGAIVLANVMEPDVNDYGTYKGTLVSTKLVRKDENDNYPIYRYIGNDPRGIFAPQTAAEEQTADPVGAVSPAADAEPRSEAGVSLLPIALMTVGAALVVCGAVVLVRKKKNKR